MLQELHVSNFVLINKIDLVFKDTLSVFTGETGAGKSLVLDAITILLGERANSSYVGAYQDYLSISATFLLQQNTMLINLLAESGIVVDDNMLIVRRLIFKDGKSKCFLNDLAVSVTFIRQIASYLVDIHNQFDNNKLLQNNHHQELLDLFLDDHQLMKNIKVSYEQYLQHIKTLKEAKEQISQLEKEHEYNQHCLQELSQYDCSLEYINLLQEKKYLHNSQVKLSKILTDLEASLNISNMVNNLPKTAKYLDQLNQIVTNSPKIERLIQYYTEFCEIFDKLAFAVEDLHNEYQVNDDEIDAIEEHLYHLNNLALKHSVSIYELAELKQQLATKVTNLTAIKEQIIKLQLVCDELYQQYQQYSQLLTEKRNGTAKKLINDVHYELSFLKFQHVEFNILIEEGNIGPLGSDKIIFKVKANKADIWKDLSKTFSGGEMARFMLALKIVFAKVSNLSTIIFDEIDVGVSGEVAEAIANRLGYLANYVQVIAITHSHHIAAFAPSHYKVTKYVNQQGVMETQAQLLQNDDRIDEIAMMIFGSNSSEATEIAAKMLTKSK